MYSRNYATFENFNTARLTTDIKRSSGGRNPQGIPVKSFSDESAFERFSSLGKNTNVSETSENIKVDSESDKQNETEDIEIVSAKVMSEADTDVSETSSAEAVHSAEESNSSPLFSEFHKILKLVEGDWFIVILAVSMLIFCSNETNDKLTPIALLAIMFI